MPHQAPSIVSLKRVRLAVANPGLDLLAKSFVSGCVFWRCGGEIFNIARPKGCLLVVFMSQNSSKHLVIASSYNVDCHYNIQTTFWQGTYPLHRGMGLHLGVNWRVYSLSKFSGLFGLFMTESTTKPYKTVEKNHQTKTTIQRKQPSKHQLTPKQKYQKQHTNQT